MYERFCRSVYLPALDKVKHSPFPAAFEEAVKNQYLDPDALKELQERKLAQILKHARLYSPHYSAMPGSKLSLHDFPLLEKEVLFQDIDRIRTGKPLGSVFTGSTSGSTGIAMRFFYDSHQWAWSETCQWRGRQWWGVERGARQMTLWARPLGSAKVQKLAWLKYRLRNSSQFNTFEEFDDNKLMEIVDTIIRFKPEFIYGYGSSLGRLGQFLEENPRVVRTAPRLIEFTADHLFQQERELLAKHLHSPVISAYGASETPGISQQCWAGNAHIAVDNVVVEFLLPDGSPAKPGELAEIVVTTLNNFEMPLIRYRVGDMGSYSNETCTCGVNLPLMELKVGKVVDLISTSSHQNISAHVLDYINLALIRDNVRGIRQFFVRQVEVDGFVLSLVPDGYPIEKAAELFRKMMRESLGEQISITTEIVDTLPVTSSGKRRYFRSDLERNPK